MNPQLPLHLLIHHSLQLHTYPNPQALQRNIKLQFQPNYQPYHFLNCPTKPFHNYNPLPPPIAILHQLNLQYLPTLLHLPHLHPQKTPFPHTLLPTHSHTTIINAIPLLRSPLPPIQPQPPILPQPSYFP
ncbi:aconitase family protein, partial [Staphylococcus aureus]|uniref:aconitase family protein n=1 Tax=Staphylococcus aureus TaxID=1280 RepID=UPI0037D99349